jgi:hypothetical protein
MFTNLESRISYIINHSFYTFHKGIVLREFSDVLLLLINEEDHLISFQDCHINTIGITTDSQVTNVNLSRFTFHESKL